jgi:hypothetical protein
MSTAGAMGSGGKFDVAQKRSSGRRRGMARPSRKPPFYGQSATDGLHTLKDDWGFQKRYLEEQCRALLENLDVAIKRTEDASPTRSQKHPFFPDKSARTRPDQIDPKNEERLLEARIWSRWRFDGPPTAEQPRLWASLVGIQVPLFDRKHRGGWGHIDLLGIDKYKAGAPVVVELKTGNSKEIPLRPVLEVVCNAIALRRNWAAFGEQLRAQLTKSGKEFTPCADNAPFTCVVLAPSAYWEQWAPEGKLGKSVRPLAWPAFRALLAALKERRYPVTFMRVSDVSADVCPFPREESVPTEKPGA